jgi:[ribosomal protein S5]-alanine N-acetyltransferase
MKPFRTHRFELRDFLPTDLLFTNQYAVWQAERPRKNYKLGVFNRGDQAVIGSAGIMMKRCKSGDATLELTLTEENKGKYAYAYEIGFALIEWGFEALSLNNLIIENSGQLVVVDRLAARAGFIQVANNSSPNEPRWVLSFGQWEGLASKLRPA